MTWPAIKFVDSPATTATVRLDLSTPTVRVLSDGFSLGVPSFSGSPGSIGVDYGYRSMSLSVSIRGSKGSALATMQSLARELLRRTNWLLFQLQPTSTPVWFKTYRGEPGDLSLENVHDETTGVAIPDRWRIRVPLTAEGFSYGALVTQSAQTLNNDPAAGTNPCFITIPTVLGDAPAPARIRNRYLAAAQPGYRHMLATSPVPSTYTAPIVWPIGGTDGWTAGTDTGASASDAVMSGGSYRPVSFATQAALTNRLTGTAPVAVPPGRYKVMLRVARSDTNSTFSFRFGSTIGFSFTYGNTVPWVAPASVAAKHAVWVDLGDFMFPIGALLEDLSGELAISPVIALQAARLSGTGAAWLDSIMLVPVGDEFSRVMFVDYPGLGPSALLTDEYHDTEQQIVYSRNNSTGALSSVPPPPISGGFPLLVPGQTNVLHFVEQTTLARSQYNGGDVPDRIATQVSMVVAYYPRYLHLAP